MTDAEVAEAIREEAELLRLGAQRLLALADAIEAAEAEEASKTADGLTPAQKADIRRRLRDMGELP